MRFIPTCVGNTPKELTLCLIYTVHPHVRGEYLTQCRNWNRLNGSSPRAWGIRHNNCNARARYRFIPTCVGNTNANPSGADFKSVHPHVRGEYPEGYFFQSEYHGSSPRAWGIQYAKTLNKKVFRFIPTCVGNTKGRDLYTTRKPVHPHVRGEYPSRKHEEFSKVIITAKIYRSGTA